ncbi:UBX domain-containing protein 1 [Microdochium nivale]|nr:UBX domain-containing protein 1 [Microdochium nivale]
MADQIPDEAISQLAGVTGLPADQCRTALEATNGNLDDAVNLLLGTDHEDDTAAAASSSQPDIDPNYTGPRTLDGRPAPEASSSSSRSTGKKPQQKKKGLQTLSSIGDRGDDDDDDSEDDDSSERRDTYAGGEKSGLALQDPNKRGASDPKKMLDEIIAQAKSNSERAEPSASAGPSTSRQWRGTAHTLGGEGVESRSIPDPQGPQSGHHRTQTGAVTERVLHIWRDGFSIDEGELYEFNDPANAQALRMIRMGRAPIHLMNVGQDEEVDVKLHEHDEPWKQLPKKYKPFGGEGHRLGSPVPGEMVPTPPAAATATASTSTASASSSAAGNVDESRPTITIRIQTLDGARLPARFNTTQTVNDVYEFISRSSPSLGSTGWVLATTFPNKDHTDKSLVLGDMPEFKRGGTAVVKRA